jgi:hypothetical protein
VREVEKVVRGQPGQVGKRRQRLGQQLDERRVRSEELLLEGGRVAAQARALQKRRSTWASSCAS